MRYFLLSFLFPLLLSAEIKTSSISSQRASYDGNALILKGEVELQHSLGTMHSGGARLIRDKKEGPFSSILLTDEVLIALKNRGEISCGKANFDFEAMRGNFVPKSGGMIQFRNLLAGPLSFSSKSADVEFEKENDLLKVTKVDANETVELQYGKEFFLTADHAVYTDGEFSSVIAEPNCVLTHYDDRITAEKVEFLPQSSKVILTAPKGRLTPSSFSSTQGVDFSCDRLIWERVPQILTLRGNVSVQDAGIGDIRCDEEVELRQREENGKWALSSITAKGKTEITYQLDEDFKHLLICYGQMQVDQDRLVLTLDSPHEQPIEYFHDEMKLCADRAELDYTEEGKTIKPRRLLLAGNVHLFIENNQSRCSIADQFAFYPEEKKMVLCAQNGNNVLFWDEEKDLSISAREVHIFRNEKGENVKGVGNVRFAFSSAENELLKKIFPFYKAKGVSNE